MQGNFDSAEEVFKVAYELAKNKRMKVYAKYNLGGIYLHYGRTDEAKEALEYVINNGNKLAVAGKAREMLEGM